MTREAHLELSFKHRELAIQSIRSFHRTMDRKDWEDYLTNRKLADKHYGIAQAMFTRKYGKI